MYPPPYLDYILYFHLDRDYFECHEVLEEHWKEQPHHKRELRWVALIQVAVALYHHRRDNENGARRMYEKAASLIRSRKKDFRPLGLHVGKLLKQIEQQLRLLRQGAPFQDIDLPIVDKSLIAACLKRSHAIGRPWYFQRSETIDQWIIDKHTRRNRDDVIAERARQLSLRRRKKRPVLTKGRKS